MLKKGLAVLFVFLFIGLGYIIINNKDTTNMGNEETRNQIEDKNIDPKEELTEETEIGANVWNKAPNFTLTDMNGKSIQLADYQGKKLMLNFWTSWCKYCKAEMNELIEFYQVKEDPNIIVLSINVSSEERKIEDAYLFVTDNKLPFPVVFDKEGEITELYRVQGYPTNFFIDQSGIIRQKILGGITLKDVQTIFDDIQ